MNSWAEDGGDSNGGWGAVKRFGEDRHEYVSDG